MERSSLDEPADELIAFLRADPSASYSLADLAGELGRSSEEIQAALARAVSWGYQISDYQSRIAFLEAPDLLTDTELSYNLPTKVIGKNILAYRQVKSTNDIAKERAEAGAPEGTVVVAEEQTLGRGRMGRAWHSPAGKGAYVSIVLRPPFPPARAPGMSLMTALALAATLEEHTPGRVSIKWPNDVLVQSRKVAGILTELSADQSRIAYVIVGVGININQDRDEFPAEIRHLATSVRIVHGKPVNRVRLLQRFFTAFEVLYQEYTEHGLAKSIGRLRDLSSLLGMHVRLSTGKRFIEGTAVDITESGSLVLEQGETRTEVSCGEVTVVKK